MPNDELACQVWWAGTGDVRPWHLGLMDPAERDRLERYLRAEDRDRFTVGVALTRLLLADRLGIRPEKVPLDRTCSDCGRPHGAPRPAGGGGPHLSVSHSGARVVVAISDGGPVGVDVEAASDRFDPDIARHLLSPAEAARTHQPDPAGLLAYWTRKEATVKATGEGLRVPLPDLTVSAPDERPRLLAWGGRPGFADRVTLRTLEPGAGYAACLALIDQPHTAVTEYAATELLTAARSAS